MSNPNDREVGSSAFDEYLHCRFSLTQKEPAISLIGYMKRSPLTSRELVNILIVFMNNHFSPNDLLIFYRVSEFRSFTKAAQHLGISKAHASQAVSRLEEHLGVRLMQRSTRSLSLTERGSILQAHARVVTEDFEEAKNAGATMSGRIQGLLRIAAPVTFTRTFIAPYLHEFLSKHEGIDVQIESTSRDIDLIEEGLDIHFRMGPPKQHAVVSKPIAKPRTILCGSPRLLKSNISKPSELRSLPFVTVQVGKDKLKFLLRRNNKEFLLDPVVRVSCTEPGAAAVLIASGAGIGFVPDFYAREHLQSKQLIELLPAWQHDTCQLLFAVYPSRKGLDSKVRMFLDWVTERIAPLISRPGAHLTP
jgi:DNA-binding transcriptional LysR family regulator